MKILFFLWIFTPVGFWSLARKQQRPCDESNRLNKLILFWFAFTRRGDLNRLLDMELTQWQLIKLTTFNEGAFADELAFLRFDLWEFLTK